MNQPLKLNLQSTMKDVDVLMGMLFTQKQDSAFTVFDNLTDAQILATLKNKNIGLNKTSTALVLVVNYDGTLYKKTIVDTVTPTPTPDYTAGVAQDVNQSHTADSNGLIIVKGSIELGGGAVWVDINGVRIYLCVHTNDGDTISLPVKKGDVYQMGNTAGASMRSLDFYPII